MRKFLLVALTLLFTSALHAEVMFTLSNLQTSHIFVKNDSSLLTKEDVLKVKTKMNEALKSIGLKSEGRDGDTMMMKFESASVKGTDIVFIKLAIASDVMTSRQDEIETFALVYEGENMIESDENTKAEIFESVQFLLDEFVESYKEDN